jgi:hypothetical protein
MNKAKATTTMNTICPMQLEKKTCCILLDNEDSTGTLWT